MEKLTKIANGIVEQYLYFCIALKSFVKSLENYVNDTNKINVLVQTVLDIFNNSLDSNITNYQYTNHNKYGNAWHCHIQLVDLINHNKQSKG